MVNLDCHCDRTKRYVGNKPLSLSSGCFQRGLNEKNVHIITPMGDGPGQEKKKEKKRAACQHSSLSAPKLQMQRDQLLQFCHPGCIYLLCHHAIIPAMYCTLRL